jgi:hypothetical protein
MEISTEGFPIQMQLHRFQWHLKDLSKFELGGGLEVSGVLLRLW